MNTTATIPTAVDDSATVVVRREVRIAAPVDVVWRLHTAVAEWPTWQTDIDMADLDGPLVPGVTFTWSTHGLDVASTVYAVDAGRRILWGGPAQGIVGIHEWVFEPDGDATVVRTAESWDGEPVRADAANLRAALDASLASWLELLKATAESSAVRLDRDRTGRPRGSADLTTGASDARATAGPGAEEAPGRVRGTRGAAVSAWAIAVLILGEFAMLAVVPVVLLTVQVFRDARLRALRWWAVAVAAAYASGLAVWALGPDRAPSLSKDLHPVHAAVIVAAAVAFAIRYHARRRQG